MSSDDDDLNKELLQVAGGRAAGGKRGRAAASASEESPSEEVDLQLMCSSSAEVLGTCYSAAARYDRAQRRTSRQSRQFQDICRRDA